MKIWVLISLLVVFLGERMVLGHPEDSNPEPAADGASNPDAAAPTSPSPASPVEPQNNGTGNVQPRQWRHTKTINCYSCTTGIIGVNKQCENGDKVGLRSSSSMESCAILEREELEGNVASWEHAERCFLIKGEGWKHRKCMGALDFLKVVDYEGFQESLKNFGRGRFELFTKHLDGFKGSACKTYDDTEICSCRNDLCNSGALNVPFASCIIILLSAIFFL